MSLIGLIILFAFPASQDLREAYPFLLGGWTTIGLVVGLLIVANAAANFVGAFMLTHAYQTNEASGIAPLEYSYLAVAPILDLLFWQTLPTWSTLAGIVLVASAGVFIAMRSAAPPEPEVSA